MPIDDMIRYLRDTRIGVGLFAVVIIFFSFYGTYEFWRDVDTDEDLRFSVPGIYLTRYARDTTGPRIWLSLPDTKPEFSNRDTQWVAYNVKGEATVAEFDVTGRSTDLPITNQEAKKVVILWTTILAVFVCIIVWMLLQFYQATVERTWGAGAGMLVGKRYKIMGAGILVLYFSYLLILYLRPRIIVMQLGYGGIESNMRFTDHMFDIFMYLVFALLFWGIGENYQKRAGGKDESNKD